MALTMLVVMGVLLTLYMHPGDMTGDRLGQLIVALLIIVTNMQMDLGLGKLTSIMWLESARGDPSHGQAAMGSPLTP